MRSLQNKKSGLMCRVLCVRAHVWVRVVRVCARTCGCGCMCVHSAPFCIVHSHIYVNNNKKATYFCVAMAIFVTCQRHNVSQNAYFPFFFWCKCSELNNAHFFKFWPLRGSVNAQPWLCNTKVTVECASGDRSLSLSFGPAKDHLSFSTRQKSPL